MASEKPGSTESLASSKVDEKVEQLNVVPEPVVYPIPPWQVQLLIKN